LSIFTAVDDYSSMNNDYCIELKDTLIKKLVYTGSNKILMAQN